jgi:hypothetical protein
MVTAIFSVAMRLSVKGPAQTPTPLRRILPQLVVHVALFAEPGSRLFRGDVPAAGVPSIS